MVTKIQRTVEVKLRIVISEIVKLSSQSTVALESRHTWARCRKVLSATQSGRLPPNELS